LRPYFTVSDLRLPFSSPPTTRRVTVEVFDPASTRVSQDVAAGRYIYIHILAMDRAENAASNSSPIVACVSVAAIVLQRACLQSRSLATPFCSGFTILVFGRYATISTALSLSV
jgi:hypothetical protein